MREVDGVEKKVVCRKTASIVAANFSSPVSAPLPLSRVPSAIFRFAQLTAHSTWLCDNNETKVPSTLRQ